MDGRPRELDSSGASLAAVMLAIGDSDGLYAVLVLL
jgi:hypothetical protein